MAASQDKQKIKFPLGQHIEVLQLRQALRGSWQPATIITVKNGRRGIEYSELFESSGVERLRESFSVMKESEKSSIRWLEKFGKKGFLRPLPPQLTSREQKIWSKGLLVDAFDKGAWWEGVLLEDIEDADEVSYVKVLFPDRDDECTVDVKNLRVSHQWDEFTGLWDVRGFWKGLSSSGDGRDTSYKEIQSLNSTPKPHKILACHSKLPTIDADASPGLSNKEEEAFSQDCKELINDKRNAAREYLFKMGYTIEFHQRLGRGREAVYITPNGKRFYSLTMACKAWKKEHNMPSNLGACKSTEAKLLSIYDIFEGSTCLGSTFSNPMKIKAAENKLIKDVSGFHAIQRADTPCIETRCLQDPQVTQSAGIPLDCLGPSSCKVKGKRGRKRRIENMLEDSHTTQSPLTTSSILISSEPKKRGRKPRLAGNPVNEVFTSNGDKKKAKRGRKPGVKGRLPVIKGTTSNVSKRGRKPCLNICSNSSTSRGEKKKPSGITFFPVLDRYSSKQGKEAYHQKDLHEYRDSYSPASTITEAMISPGVSSSNCEEVNLQVEGKGKVDDICSACGDGGDLVLCDHCPSTYHAECAGLEAIPEGNWYCFGCCCASCEGFLFDTDDSSLLVTCKQCEKKYHVNCSPSEGRHVKDILAKDLWFCGMSCEQIYIGLHQQIGVSYPLDTGGLSWALLKSNTQEDCSASMASNSKLSIAHDVMQECFVPMVDISTGVDIISQALYSRGSQMVRLNCLGFYTLILERGCELISVATFRIHGSRLAEMPFIGTRFLHRRKGMCRQLMCVLEKMLKELGVRNLLLPAVPQLLRTWKSKFDFQHINSWDRMEVMRMNLMRFPGTTLLKKNMIKSCLELHVRCRSMQSSDLPSNTQGRESLMCDGKSIGDGSELKRSKKSRNKVGKIELDSGDAKVIIATTKFKRLVKSSQWYVDSMKELSHDAELLRNEQRSRIKMHWKKKHKKLLAVSEKNNKKNKRGGIHSGTIKLRLKIRKPEHKIQDQEPIMEIHYDGVSGVPAIDRNFSTLLNTQDPTTCARFYTRRKAINNPSGFIGKSITDQFFVDAVAQQLKAP